MGLILAADAGTTNIKAGLVDEAGRVLSVSGTPARLVRSEPGAAEHHPDELFRDFAFVCRKAAGGRAREVEAVVVSSYHMGLLALDRSLKPLTLMSTILDMRAQETLALFHKRCDSRETYRRTGCPPFANYMLSRLFWLKEKRPRVFGRAAHFWGSKDYLMWRLTGEAATEPSTACATQLMNVRTLKWDGRALGIAEVSERQLAPIVRSDRVLGGLVPEAARLMGLTCGVKVVPGVYDGGGLVLGIGGLKRGIGTLNLGTSAMFRVSAGTPVFDGSGQMRISPYTLLPGAWIPGAGLNNAGNAIAWFIKLMGLSGYSKLASLAAKARRGEDDPLFFPYLTGERDPRIGSFASGAFFGLREHHRPADLALAVLEGVGYSIRLILEALRENGTRIREIRAGGGGAGMPFWVRTLADMFGAPIRTSRAGHPSLVGSAILGFVATGRYGSVAEATRRMVRLGRAVVPSREGVRLHSARFSRFARALAVLAEMTPRGQRAVLGRLNDKMAGRNV